MSCWMKNNSVYEEKRADQKNKTNVPLQVRSPFYEKNMFSAQKQKKARSGSRAFPFISFPECWYRTRHGRHRGKAGIWKPLRASLTLEAALVLPLLIFASVCLMLPAKIMMTERKLQAGLEEAGEELSQYAYLLDSVEQGNLDGIPGAGEAAKAFSQNAAAVAAPLYARSRALAYCDTANVSHVSMLGSSVREDGETLDLVMDYEISFPFPVLGLSSLHRTVRSRRRCWIGREGRYGEGTDHVDEDERIVYVGRNSTRYHPDQSCHYLSNKLTAVSWESVSNKRNTDGSKYYPCSACAKGAGKGSTVYIMPSGGKYHALQDCKAIMAYVRAVKLKEVKHLGACSYCGG